VKKICTFPHKHVKQQKQKHILSTNGGYNKPGARMGHGLHQLHQMQQALWDSAAYSSLPVRGASRDGGMGGEEEGRQHNLASWAFSVCSSFCDCDSLRNTGLGRLLSLFPHTTCVGCSDGCICHGAHHVDAAGADERFATTTAASVTNFLPPSSSRASSACAITAITL
jgi:hypothetical protein